MPLVDETKLFVDTPEVKCKSGKRKFTFEREPYDVTRQDFILSDKLSHRVTRHLSFWMAFGLIFTIQSIGDPLGGFFSRDSVIRALKFDYYNLPFCIVFVYLFSNFLFPRFLKKKKYAAFIAGFILVAALGVWINYYATVFYFQSILVNNLTIAQKIIVGNNTVWSAIVAGGFVLGFKLSKHWYLQQNENILLAKQKANTELKLLKARIHPDFLFKTLDDIYKKINSGSDKSPLLILKLSELLSYLLYESGQKLVPLEKELTAVTDFISISKLTMPDRLLSLKIIGKQDDKFIPPLLLLTLVQNSFDAAFTGKTELIKTTITVLVKDDLLILLLSFQFIKKDDSHVESFKAFAQSEQRRINLLFPENNYILELSNQGTKIEASLIISLSHTHISATFNNADPAKKEVYETT